jgi:hypothetical protein
MARTSPRRHGPVAGPPTVRPRRHPPRGCRGPRCVSRSTGPEPSPRLGERRAQPPVRTACHSATDWALSVAQQVPARTSAGTWPPPSLTAAGRGTTLGGRSGCRRDVEGGSGLLRDDRGRPKVSEACPFTGPPRPGTGLTRGFEPRHSPHRRRRGQGTDQRLPPSPVLDAGPPALVGHGRTAQHSLHLVVGIMSAVQWPVASDERWTPNSREREPR